MRNIRKLLKGQKGFTLIELVVVIAILGVLAAVSVPLITNYLGQAKERAYNNDVKMVQAAVDAYYSAPDNTRFIGQRQYPIYGMDVASSTLSDLLDDATEASVDLKGNYDPLNAVNHKNPLSGTVGGNPVWTDDADGIRSGTPATDNEENVNGPGVVTPVGWHVVLVTRQTKDYYVDTRDYIIDMEKLTAKGLLDGVPASAAADNCPTETCTGSYIYYVGSDGKVQTLLASFPEADKTGFQDVHP
ncbi:MAG: prepilin-type N-terminal cleavage/methylation domain-containing protein [Chloroflexi bacterium]|nr:prepilin-type N-terminal cleavage/methylation domain-containing protein [Chloroflexota bacterium]